MTILKQVTSADEAPADTFSALKRTPSVLKQRTSRTNSQKSAEGGMQCDDSKRGGFNASERDRGVFK
jgi:hypothetical protein